MKLFKKPKSKFYWYDFTVRGRRYRASTQETKSVRALQIASLKLASVMERTDPLPTKPAVLHEFAHRFLVWVNGSRLEEKTRKFYRNGWRLLKSTSVAMLRVDQITGDCAEQLRFPGSAANANCALRTLRRMLHKAEEWKMIGHAPKIKMMKEHGRHLRLDDEAERKLITGALACNWRPRTRELFGDIVILMRDTGMRNERELFRMRIEKEELDRFATAMSTIREEIRAIEEGRISKEDNPLKNAPHTAAAVTAAEWTHPYSRETAAFPAAWTHARKFWPAVGRINNALGDRHLVCACPPIDDYA